MANHEHSFSCLTGDGSGHLVCKVTGESSREQPKDGVAMAFRACESGFSSGQPLLIETKRGSGAILGVRRFAEKFFPPRSRSEIESLASKLGIPEKSPIFLSSKIRAPHHTVSVDGMVGTKKRPYGEWHLARHGVLILDEVEEFSRSTLEALASKMRTDHHPVFVAAIAYSKSGHAERVLELWKRLTSPMVVEI